MTEPKKYQLGVVIGRFQPFHHGHKELVDCALRMSHRVLIVLGSARSARTTRNPWTDAERKAMIQDVLGPHAEQVSFAGVPDQYYDNQAWCDLVIEAAEAVLGSSPPVGDVSLFGLKKDITSKYLEWFPNWALESDAIQGQWHATQIRDRIFNPARPAPDAHELENSVARSTARRLIEFAKSSDGDRLKREWVALDDYKRSWSSAPFPPVFVTTDAVVESRGQVLLIRRRSPPGEGLWALPGGFVEPDERIQDSAIRELAEETRLGVSADTLRAALRTVTVFDHPFRSLRGRAITHVHHFVLDDHANISLEAGDDAKEAVWTPISQLAGLEDQMFEDHFVILKRLIRAPILHPMHGR